jgi:hypothetical protein
MRLETATGEFVADVEPLLPLTPTQVVFWGERVFVEYLKKADTWREVRPTVVQEKMRY